MWELKKVDILIHIVATWPYRGGHKIMLCRLDNGLLTRHAAVQEVELV